jgi:hypothetical protein
MRCARKRSCHRLISRLADQHAAPAHGRVDRNAGQVTDCGSEGAVAFVWIRSWPTSCRRRLQLRGHKRPYGPAPCLDRFTFNCGNSWGRPSPGSRARLRQFSVCSVHVPFAVRGRRACNFGRATPSLRYKPGASLTLIHAPHHVCSTSITVAQIGFLQPRGQIYYIFVTSINTSTRDPYCAVRAAPP